jgi:hypothetical protein
VCRYCDNGESLIENEEVNVDIQGNRISVYIRSNDTMETVQVGYCPMCGRQLHWYTD